MSKDQGAVTVLFDFTLTIIAYIIHQHGQWPMIGRLAVFIDA